MGDAQPASDSGDHSELRPAYEGTYQYMDLKPEGYNDRHAVNGSFYKLTFAPTFKVGSIGDFFSRPEIRLYTSWMDWSKNWIITPAMMR